MKKIVLIGDSIRMGYDKYVKDALAHTAEVFYPDENCKFAEYVLRFVHEWKDRGAWGDNVDLVHWNAGLWDVLELFGDAPLTSLAYYEEVIGRIDRRLRMLFPRANMVFATSTSVVEAMADPTFRRHNATIEAYNAAARRALASTDTVINDLYTLTSAAPQSLHSDFVHFNTPEGTALIGGQVLSVIGSLLALTPKAIRIEEHRTEAYTKEEIGY